MANEWVKVELMGENRDGEPRRYTIADGDSVSKGQLLELLDPRTASASLYRVVPTAYAGIAAEEHKAGEGVTSIAVWTNGVFEATASLAIVVGAPITGTSANMVTSSSALIVASGANILGYALEAATDAEVINVRLRL